MAQDYDSPRNKDEDEESLQALSKGSQNNSNDMDDDENAIAEDDECFLVKHRSQLAYTTDDGQPVCKECAA